LMTSAMKPERWIESYPVSAMACLAVVLLAPLCVSLSIDKPFSLGLPRVFSGDEPHYLLLINSVINDADFDLANNYHDVHQGGLQAGRNFSGSALNHHVNWYQHDHIFKWWQAYELDAEKWAKDGAGHPVPTFRSDSTVWPVSEHEYSQHPVGLAFLLAPFLFALRGTSLVEPGAIFCSGLATVAGCYSWCWLVKPYTRSTTHLLGAAAVAYLGSPLWHYGQTLYSEPFLACLGVAAYASALRAEKYWLAGLLLAAGVLIKTPFGLIALPLVGDALVNHRLGQALKCTIPVALAGVLVSYWNRNMYGGWLNNPQEWESGSLAQGLFGLAFSCEHGLLLFSPALCLSALTIPDWFRGHRRDATLMTLAALLYGGLMAYWVQWWGGACYSARLIVPIVPFLYAPMALLFDSKMWRVHRLVRIAGILLIILSIAFGAVGAFGCDYVLNKHPVQLLWGS
jgi:hypothetical protein